MKVNGDDDTTGAREAETIPESRGAVLPVFDPVGGGHVVHVHSDLVLDVSWQAAAAGLTLLA